MGKIKELLLSVWYGLFGSFFRLLPIKRHCVVFSNFFGKGFGDSPKYIADELIRRGGYTIVWIVDRGLDCKDFPKNIKVVNRKSLLELYYFSVASVWIFNTRKPYELRKRKNQFYIQTWHSSLRLKKIEKDAEKYLYESYIRTAKRDSESIDLITSGCGFSTGVYKNSFWYNGPVLECGTPRCDIFFDNKKSKMLRMKICNKYHLDPAKKIILYAPTFRRDKKFDDRYLDCDKFFEKMCDDYELLIRIHPRMGVNVDGRRAVDVTDYPDMQELICAVDYLITDYSGCCFDMMIAKKPCVLYVPDLKQYLENERELYFSFDELPFKKTSNMDELASAIKGFNYDEYMKNVQAFGEKIGLCEKGNASETIVDLITKKCEGKK